MTGYVISSPSFVVFRHLRSYKMQCESSTIRLSKRLLLDFVTFKGHLYDKAKKT